MNQTNLQKDTSMLNWFPKIEALMPVPKTEILPITSEEFYSIIGLLDGNMISDDLLRKIKSSASVIGYPLFMRSDMTSAKHSYVHTCHVLEEKKLIGNLVGLIEDHLMKDLFPRAIVFRELLNLHAPFRAFDGLPIAKERRYFVDGGKVLCHHPYWPENAIEQGRNNKQLPAQWKDMLAVISEEDKGEVAYLSKLARVFNKFVPGFYSVDFAQTRNGSWYMIDAARGELSWHPEHI